MSDYTTEAIRNLVLMSHSGAGKTSLVEAMLFNAGVINRLGKVDGGTTTSDYDPAEIKKKASINLSILSFEHKDKKINVIDTPGYADFVGEVKGSIRVADTAVLVICATSGVEVGTELSWKYAEAQGIPRVIYINKIDRENADFYKVADQAKSMFGEMCVPMQLPIGAEADFTGVIDLLKMKAVIDDKEQDIPADLVSDAEVYRDGLLEALAEADDDLCAKYLEGEDLSEDEVAQALRVGINTGKVVPILVGSALVNKAIQPFMDMVCDYLPSPADRGSAMAGEAEIAPDASGNLAALVFKTTADPYVGRLTYFRIYAGTLFSDTHVFNASKKKDERVGQLLTIRGKEHLPVAQMVAGDIGGVAKLSETATSDTLCKQENPVVFDAIQFPPPVYSVAVHPKTKADMDKMGSALNRLVEEDPTLKVYKDPETSEMLISGMGDSHIDVAVERMQRKFGANVLVQPPRVPFRETIKATAKAEYKHKKQSGGHGQYGHVHLEFEPLPRGQGSEFGDRIVGGVVPKNYIPAVEKGIHEALTEGVLAGYPVVDVKVTLFYGSYHPVDSSEMAFKIAAHQAFKKGIADATPILLEPVMDMKITVPDSYMGDAMSDLNTKRAKVMGMNPSDGVTTIEAQAPLSEVLRYATDLRSITQGRGSFTMEMDHYAEVPAHTAQKIIEDGKKEKEKKE
ncbi:MAG: elongation factor G [Chloroflexi bacterium]|jgi:elongation factor G|nr:elongation factor G [Chloroflexota bacterium]MBT7080118.1 elongation factor G [Chloroflexota bacterium]MBT7290196.1 elongation factor G [Chloroflexota bacterium]